MFRVGMLENTDLDLAIGEFDDDFATVVAADKTLVEWSSGPQQFVFVCH